MNLPQDPTEGNPIPEPKEDLSPEEFDALQEFGQGVIDLAIKLAREKNNYLELEDLIREVRWKIFEYERVREFFNETEKKKPPPKKFARCLRLLVNPDLKPVGRGKKQVVWDVVGFVHSMEEERMIVLSNEDYYQRVFDVINELVRRDSPHLDQLGIRAIKADPPTFEEKTKKKARHTITLTVVRKLIQKIVEEERPAVVDPHPEEEWGRLVPAEYKQKSKVLSRTTSNKKRSVPPKLLFGSQISDLKLPPKTKKISAAPTTSPLILID